MAPVIWQESLFGSLEIDGKIRQVKQFSNTNKNGITVQIITYGAAIRALKIPDRNGVVEDVVTGFDRLQDYRTPANRFFGATIGRAANRLYKGQLKINGTSYNLSTNHPSGNHLHGGYAGFDKVVWEHYVDGNNRLILSYAARDLEEGYPGDFLIHTIYELTDDNDLLVEYRANSTKPTFVNVTNHSYFNLAGHCTGPEGLFQHVIGINADRITEVVDGVTTGKLLDVSGTPFDFRTPKLLADWINKVPNSPGFDHNYCINTSTDANDKLSFVASALHPESGRLMKIFSNQPGLQFYTANFLAEVPFEGVSKEGKPNYQKHGAFCMEPQKYPNSPNIPNFPSAILNPGENYLHKIRYHFSTQ